MLHTHWSNTGRKYILCVDSYGDGVLKGRICDPYRDPEPFSSLSRFLLRMEQLLDEEELPQAFTQHRRFAETLSPDQREACHDNRKGRLATFELKVIFRQNSSWQGTLIWRETRQEQNFRSVLEMIVLLDSALRSV